MKFNFNTATGRAVRRLFTGLLFTGSILSISNAQVSMTASTGVLPLTRTYTTLGGAFADINNGQLQGVITIDISANTNEGATPATLHSSGAGSISYTSVVIRPANDGVSISGNPATGSGVIQLNGADNVTIDGDNPNTGGTNRNLTVSNTAATSILYNSTIRIATSSAVTSADNNTIKNCILSGNVTGGNLSTITGTGTTSNTSFGIYIGGNGGATSTTAPTAITSITTNTAISGTTVNTLVIDNNAISQCARAIVFNGAATTVSTGITVTNNVIGDQSSVSGTPPYTSPSTTVYTKGIWINGTNALTVSGNTLNNIMSYVGTPICAIELAGAIGTGTITISGNTITSPTQNQSGTGSTVKAILVSASSGAYTVSGNIISNVQSIAGNTQTDAIEVAVGSGTIEKNKITKINSWFAFANEGGIGINVTGGSNTIIRNNFISDINANATSANFATSATLQGIRISSGTGHKVLHNSVNLFGTVLGTPSGNQMSACLFISATSVTGLDVRNNIFSNTMNGGAAGSAYVSIYLPTLGTSMNLTLNNNAYYCGSGTSQGIAQVGTSSGTNFYLPGNFNAASTSPSTNLRAYTSTLSVAGTNDNASIVSTSAAPFTSTSDLHIPAATASQFESGGASVGVATDIDGNVRPGPAGSVNGGATAPDLGADEFDGIPVDLSAPLISYTALVGTCSTTDRTFTATISDASGVPVAGALQPRVYYKKNAGSYFSSQGVLSSGSATSGTWTFTIAAADMGGVAIGDVVSYFVIAQDIAGTPNVSSNPAGVVAANVNTVSTPPASPGTYLIQSTLSGSFTVGTGQNYNTLTAAVFAYNNSCLTGPVTFVLTDASYPSEVLPITIGVNPFASATNTLTIKPGTGVAASIAGSSTAAIIKLSGADYITIDGLNAGGSSLTLTNNDGTTTGSVVWVGSANASDGATNDVIKNCNLIGNASTTTLAGVFAGSGTTSAGTAEASNSNLTVQGCSITKTKNGIYANGNSTTSDANWNFTQNTIGSTSVAADKLGASAIILFNAQNFSVSSNTINGVVSASTTTASGIGLFSNISAGSIFNNRISDIKNTNTGAAQGSNGMQLSAATTASNVSIYNNFIWDVASFGSSGVSATANGWGILISGGGGYNIYFNTVYLSTDQSFASSVTAAVNITNGALTSNSINLRNNILVNTQTVGTNRYAILCGAAVSVLTDIDYNDYYFTGPNLGRISSLDQPNLAAWQGATSKDANSLSVDPSFVSTTNLHLITSSSPLDNSGVSIAGITTDIDGDSRPATPDMGADEFTFSNNNCSGTPTAGTITASATLCPGAPTTLNISGYTQGVLGIVFQWEESDDNGGADPWANAVGGTGATTFAYTTPGNLSAIYYRCKVTCSASGLFAYTNACAISITPFTLPENFAAFTFPAPCWTNNNPTYVFRSGVSAFGSGSGSAEYNFYSATYLANLDLTTPVFAAQPAGNVLVFDHAYATSNAFSIDELDILYSTNGGSSYTLLISYAGGVSGPLNTGGLTGGTTQFVPTAGQWASKLVTLPTGTNRLIFRGIGQFGNNLYIDNINILPPGSCNTPAPSASNLTPTSADISWTCAGCTGSYDLDYGAAGHLAGTGTIITGVSSTYTLNPPLTPNTAYTVYVRQNCGVYGFSSWSGAVNFTTPCASPVPVASTNVPLCNGGDINLMSVNNAAGQTSGNTYAWTGPGGFTSSHQDTTITSATAAKNGTYSVTVTNQYGCTASASVNVVVNPNPTVSASSNAPFCSATQNLNLISNSPTGTMFSWSGPGGYTAATGNPSIVNAPNTASGTYKVIATDANGCKDSATTAVTIYALPNVGITLIGNSNLCTGQTSVDLQGTGALTFLWSTSSTASLITVSTAGTYSVTGTDAHSCSNGSQVVITESAAPAAPIVTPAGPINLCSSDGGVTFSSATLTVTNYSANLLWSTSETTTSIVVDYGDVFNVTYTDPAGCYAVSNSVTTNTYLASEDPTGVSSNALNNNICLGNTVSLSVTGGTLGDNADWHWYEGTGACGTGTARGTGSSISVTPSTAGVHHYTVRAEGPCNNTLCASIDITVSSAPPSGTSHFTAAITAGCNGTSGVFSTNAVAGASFYSWSGTSGALFNGNPGPYQTTSPSVTVTFATAPPAGASGYSICSFAGNACGQSNTICTWVRAKVTQPGIINGSNIGCPSTNGAYSVAAIVGADTYTWTISGSATINGGTATLTTASPSITLNFLAGWTSGTLTVYASMNCGFNSASRSIAISNTPAIPGTMNGVAYVCPGSSSAYSVAAVTGASSYSWTCSVPGAVVSPAGTSCSILFPAVIPAGAQVCVSAVSSCGNASPSRCKGIANGIPNIPGSISGPSSGQCSQSGVSYSLSPVLRATSYLWTVNNGATISGPANLSGVSVNFPPVFTNVIITVVAINSCGSSASRTLIVTGSPLQPGVITGSQSVCANGVELYSSTGSAGATSYNWTVPVGSTILNSPPYGATILVNWGPTGGNVSVSAVNDCGTSSSRTLPVAVTCRGSQVQSSLELAPEIYPNPVHDHASVKFTSAQSHAYQLTVFDVVGNKLMVKEGTSSAGDNVVDLDLNNYAKGMYVIRLVNGDQSSQMQFSIQ